MLCNLLLLFFSPATAAEVRLRQCLSVFLPAYAFSSRQHQVVRSELCFVVILFTHSVGQALCAEAVIPAMRRILMADPSSMLRKIDWSLFCKFAAHLIDTANAHYDVIASADAPSYQEQVMLRIAYEMRGEEKGHNQFWFVERRHVLADRSFLSTLSCARVCVAGLERWPALRAAARWCRTTPRPHSAGRDTWPRSWRPLRLPRRRRPTSARVSGECR